MMVPYTQGLSKSIMNICGKVGIQVHFRGGNITKSLLMTSKEKDNITQKSRVIYRHKCQRLESDEKYIRRLCKDLWEEVQGAPQGTLCHL